MNLIVYSAIYGGYDEVKQQPLKSVPVLFSDREASTWDTRIVDRPEQHPRMRAKYFKCNPHKELVCDVSVWIDGSATIRHPSFEDWCIEQLGDNDIALIKHPERDCIYDEANYCQFMQKYQGVPVVEQVQEYQKQGYPAHNGLWACGLLIRRHNDKIKKFNRMWWRHNKKYTYQDQLSFPVCARECGLKISTIELPNLLNNSVVTFGTPHKSNL